MRNSFICLMLSAGIMISPLSLAAALQVSPTNLTFRHAGERARAKQVWLTATGDRQVSGQVRVYEWTQRDGQDVLTETRDVIASPPVMIIPAGETQVVRLINKTTSTEREKAYRLIIDELPADDELPARAGVNLLLKYSVPVFVPPPPEKAEEASLQGVQFHLKKEGAQRWLVADSSLRTHIQLSQLDYVTRDGKVMRLHQGLLGYVLAGGHREWGALCLRSPVHSGLS